jgi:dTDP-4-amino-4,6-dideoxygalactose transaminase
MPVSTVIPLVDLGAQHRQVAGEVTAGIAAVMASGAFINGPDVVAFEQEYSTFSGAAHTIGVGNGTDALELALRGARVEAGSEVVLPANTFIATAEAVMRTGLQVRLVDCDPTYQLIDPEQVAAAVGPRTGAVIGVDLFGQVAPFEHLTGLGVPVIEDAAQSQGASRHGQSAGTFGAASGTSFYPGKNLGAYGDAGAVTTNRDDVAEVVRALRNHGGVRKYEHTHVGVNSRLDTVQAVVLRAKLKRLAGWNSERRLASDRYATLLADEEAVTVPSVLDGNVAVWHLYVVQVDHRDEVLAALNGAGIGAGIHYPTPVHLTEAFAFLGCPRGSFPVAERAADRILSLPIFPGITEDQQVRVVETLRKAVRR